MFQKMFKHFAEFHLSVVKNKGCSDLFKKHAHVVDKALKYEIR